MTARRQNGSDLPALSYEAAGLRAKHTLLNAGEQLKDAVVLGYYPQAARNPFQDMLYCAAPKNHFACFSVEHYSQVAAPVSGITTVMHYHWVHRVFSDCNSRREAAEAANEFLRAVDAQRSAGIFIVWTLHNVLSHNARFPLEETALRAGLAARADAIHIMNPATRELVAKYYELDGTKVFHVPHPSYRGAYPDFMPSAQARLNLGLSSEAKVALLFGSLSPQKGTRQFLSELSNINESLDADLEVIIAGTPDSSAYMEDIYKLAAARPTVRVIEKHIDEPLLQTLFKASDIVLCPYNGGLNSGVAATAATYGRPCVVPDVMVPGMAGAEAGIIGFNSSDRGSLAQAIKSALTAAKSEDARSDLSVWADRHQPKAISQAFFSELSARIKA